MLAYQIIYVQIGINIHQWEYSNHSHDQWILEPVNYDVNFGLHYARANSHQRLDAYPDCSDSKIGGDCTNFASQCMLAAGIHQFGDWYMKRKNTNYHYITNVNQLNNSWRLADPSPWISATEFKKMMEKYCGRYCEYTGESLAKNPYKPLDDWMTLGDVVQYAETFLETDIIKKVHHTMYVTGQDYYNIGDKQYINLQVSYHSVDNKNIDLTDIAKAYPKYRFFVYDVSSLYDELKDEGLF